MRAVLLGDLQQGIALSDPRHTQLLRTAAKDTRTRVRVLGAQGELLCDSHGAGVPEGPEPAPPRYFGTGLSARHERSARRALDAEAWPELPQRREVRAALGGTPATQTRVARTPHAVFLFTALPVSANGSVAAVVYVTRSTAPVLLDLYRVRSGLFKLLAATLCLSVGVTLLLALSISRPLTLLSRAAKRVAAGERSAPLPQFGTLEIRELSQSFRTMTEELKQRLTYISELSADVAHEFKSPLTSIRGAAELLADGAYSDPEARERILHNILLDTARLDRLVSRLLLLSRIEASAEEMTLVDLRGLLDKTARRARERGAVELSYAASHTWVRGREADLETALVNLLDNAQRYSPPTAAVKLSAREEAGGLCIAVEDLGPGVPEARRDKIWARFYTTDAESGGTGPRARDRGERRALTRRPRGLQPSLSRRQLFLDLAAFGRASRPGRRPIGTPEAHARSFQYAAARREHHRPRFVDQRAAEPSQRVAIHAQRGAALVAVAPGHRAAALSGLHAGARHRRAEALARTERRFRPGCELHEILQIERHARGRAQVKRCAVGEKRERDERRIRTSERLEVRSGLRGGELIEAQCAGRTEQLQRPERMPRTVARARVLDPAHRPLGGSRRHGAVDGQQRLDGVLLQRLAQMIAREQAAHHQLILQRAVLTPTALADAVEIGAAVAAAMALQDVPQTLAHPGRSAPTHAIVVDEDRAERILGGPHQQRAARGCRQRLDDAQRHEQAVLREVRLDLARDVQGAS